MTPERTAVLVVTGVVAVLLALTIARSEPGSSVDRMQGHEERKRRYDRVRDGGGTHFIVIDDQVPPVRPVVDVRPAPRPQPRSSYLVRKGDTLDAIARRLVGGRGGLRALMAANPGVDPRRLQIGQALVIPAKQPAAPPNLSRDAPRSYVVRKGESLEMIAKRLLGRGSAWRSIYSANRDVLTNPHRIRHGMRLRIPGG